MSTRILWATPLLDQVPKGIIGVGGGLLGHSALDDPAVLVVLVAMLALLGLAVGLVLRLLFPAISPIPPAPVAPVRW